MKSLWVENEEVVTKAAEGLKGHGVAGSLADPDEAPHLKSEKVIALGGSIAQRLAHLLPMNRRCC